MNAGYYFDKAAADRAVEFFRRFLRHAKGEWAGQHFELAEWQEERIIRPLFGWMRMDGTRRYRTVYVEVGRGAGKTTLAAGIALYLLLADGEQGAECYSAACDREQARLAFDLAKSMVEAEPALRKRCKVYRNAIVVPSTGSSYKVISADAATKHGYNSHGIIFDELAQQPNRDLYDVLHTSTGKRRQPVEFLITTAGVYDPESIGWQLHQYALQVRDGLIEDDSFLPVIFAADPEDDIHSEDTWRKANPNYPLSPKPEYMAAEAKKAAELPSYTNVFLQLHLGIWTQQVTRWLPLSAWEDCKQDLPDLTGRACYGGLDLSTTTDLSAFSLVFPPLFDGEPYYVLPFFWIPEAKLRDNRDRVPYDAWARRGLVTVTDGDVVDYDRIRADLNELSRRYAIREVRFDRWNSTQLSTQLAEQDGFTMTQFGQGFVSMSAPTKELERKVIGHTLAHDGNPVLRWMVGNVAVRTDPAGNIKPDKSKSTQRIDGVVATIMALSGAMAGTGPSVYAERGLLTL